MRADERPAPDCGRPGVRFPGAEFCRSSWLLYIKRRDGGLGGGACRIHFVEVSFCMFGTAQGSHGLLLGEVGT
jgi:hypothetical protein